MYIDLNDIAPEIISQVKSSNEYHIGYRTAVYKACDVYCSMCTKFRPTQRSRCILKERECDELVMFRKEMEE